MVKLVKETMPLTGMKCVGALPVIAEYNPFFEKATCPKAKQGLLRFCFNPEFTASKRYNPSIINQLAPEKLRELSRFILSGLFAERFRGNKDLEKKSQHSTKKLWQKRQPLPLTFQRCSNRSLTRGIRRGRASPKTNATSAGMRKRGC